MGRVGKGEERVGGCGTEASLKELTGRQGARKGRGCAGGKEGKEEGVAGRRGCLLPHKPTQARPNPNYHHGFAASYIIRAQVRQQLSNVITLDQSHRCSGPLQQLLHDLVSDRGVSNECWILLQQRLLTAADPRLADPHFAPAVSPVGVLRHSIRALKTLQRAQAAAAAMGRRLLLSVAADRCTFANRPLALTSELAQEADAVHTLSATANLPGILALYPGVELCLETKVCSELGVVRGCPVLVEDILLPENEPFLILHLLYLFLLCFAFLLFSIHKHVSFFAVYPFLPMLPLRYFEPNPNLPPHPLLHLPTALLLRVPSATWVKHPALGPGRFLLSARTHPWRFYPARPPPEGFHFEF